MITLTITLKSTAHQIVLGYKTSATAEQNLTEAIDKTGGDGVVCINDDYGQYAQYANSDVASIVKTDLDQYREYIVAKQAWKLRTETAFATYCQQNPDLAPFIGRGPGVFGG